MFNKSNTVFVLVVVVALGYFLFTTFRNRAPSVVGHANTQGATLSQTAEVANSKGQASAVVKLAPAPDGQISAEALHQLKVLDSILSAHNDNDTRMDTELKVLSEETKKILRQKYASIAPERRNDRGTIVFLLGRNLSTNEDFKFLQEVVAELPCFSLENCAKPEDPGFSKDQGEHNSSEVLLAYPQLVALKALQKILGSSADAALRAQALRVAREAEGSKTKTVAKTASKIDEKYR